MAPVQGYAAGIPWEMHLRAYDAYCKRWGPQPALIDLQGRNCRGGFDTIELDGFIPGWRDELSAIKKLEAQLQAKEQELADLRAFKVSLMNTLHTFSTAEGDILAAARSLESRIADRDETIRHLKQVPPPKPDAPDALRYNWLRRFDHFSAVNALLDTTQFNTLDAAVDHLMQPKPDAGQARTDAP